MKEDRTKMMPSSTTEWSSEDEERAFLEAIRQRRETTPKASPKGSRTKKTSNKSKDTQVNKLLKLMTPQQRQAWEKAREEKNGREQGQESVKN